MNILKAFRACFTSVTPILADPSRRKLLSGLAAAGVLALAAPALLSAGKAQAEELDDFEGGFRDDDGDSEFRLAQTTQGNRTYRRRERREDRRDRREDRRDDRRDRRSDRRERRWRRRELARECRNSRRFRRDNPELCRRVAGMTSNSGACVQVGPVVICE